MARSSFKNIQALITTVFTAVVLVSLAASPTLAVEATYPAARMRQSFVQRVWSRVRGAFRGAACAAENKRLRRELQALALAQTDVERLEAENDRLRQALAYAARTPGAWQVAGVLTRQGGASAAHKTLRVDRGSRAGVAVGAIAVVPEGLVGRVTEVSPNTCVVTLVTDPSVRVACQVESPDARAWQGVLVGGDAERLSLRFLSGTGELPVRSRVVTSGLGGVFPAGLTVGTLLEVERDAKGLVRGGDVLPAVDFAALEDVFIRVCK